MHTHRVSEYICRALYLTLSLQFLVRYVMGGYDGEGMVSSVEVFDPRMECWAMAEPMNFSRGYGATVVLGDHLLTMGGVEDQETIVESVCCFHFILFNSFSFNCAFYHTKHTFFLIGGVLQWRFWLGCESSEGRRKKVFFFSHCSVSLPIQFIDTRMLLPLHLLFWCNFWGSLCATVALAFFFLYFEVHVCAFMTNLSINFPIIIY